MRDIGPYLMNTIMMEKGSKVLTLTVPLHGVWILYVTSVLPTTCIVEISNKSCQEYNAGEDCKNKIENITSNDKLLTDNSLTKNGSLKYYSIYNSRVNDLIISIQNNNATSENIPFTMYAAFNRVPLLDKGIMVGYDISGCNVAFCNKVKSINLKASASPIVNVVGFWTIVVQSTMDNSETYQIWSSNVCPNNCSQHGYCQVSPKNYGTCKCEDVYKNFACSESILYIEYIVLVVIAALVVLSAVIGVFAWINMRRANYEKIKSK